MQVKNKLCKESMVKILKGAGIAGGGAFLVVALQGVIELDLGVYTELSVAVGAILINAIKEFVAGKQK